MNIPDVVLIQQAALTGMAATLLEAFWPSRYWSDFEVECLGNQPLEPVVEELADGQWIFGRAWAFDTTLNRRAIAQKVEWRLAFPDEPELGRLLIRGEAHNARLLACLYEPPASPLDDPDEERFGWLATHTTVEWELFARILRRMQAAIRGYMAQHGLRQGENAQVLLRPIALPGLPLDYGGTGEV